MWQVLQLIPYIRANAGMAWLALGSKSESMSTTIRTDDL
jgi:hypothetical protein